MQDMNSQVVKYELLDYIKPKQFQGSKHESKYRAMAGFYLCSYPKCRNLLSGSHAVSVPKTM
jgi:hypothetical protein